MSFSDAFTATIQHEGGYSNDPEDRGGETYMGISRKNHPGWPGWVVIDACLRARTPLSSDKGLTDSVRHFYQEMFWEKAKCDLIDRIAPTVANELFDSAVNCGIGNGAKFLQAALDTLNVNGKYYPDLAIDGGAGNVTVEAVKKCVASGGGGLLLKCQNGEQYLYYKSLPQHERYRGWFGRT